MDAIKTHKLFSYIPDLQASEYKYTHTGKDSMSMQCNHGSSLNKVQVKWYVTAQKKK